MLARSASRFHRHRRKQDTRSAFVKPPDEPTSVTVARDPLSCRHAHPRWSLPTPLARASAPQADERPSRLFQTPQGGLPVSGNSRRLSPRPSRRSLRLNNKFENLPPDRSEHDSLRFRPQRRRRRLLELEGRRLVRAFLRREAHDRTAGSCEDQERRERRAAQGEARRRRR